MPPHCIIIGLGNADSRYAGTRHNVGRTAVEHFVASNGDVFEEWRYDAELQAQRTSGLFGDHRVGSMLPELYMNESGKSARAACETYPDSELIVVHDDLDIGFGMFKISRGRGAGGHNGVQSVIDETGTTAFTRVRIGIAPRNEEGAVQKPSDSSRFVLQRFTEKERARLNHLFEHTDEALSVIVREGTGAAMNWFNR